MLWFILVSGINLMVNGLHLYRAFIQSAVHDASPSHTHTHTHNTPTAIGRHARHQTALVE